MKKFRWQVYAKPEGNYSLKLGEVETDKKDLGDAGVEAKRLYPQAYAVWLIGETFGGRIS